MDLDLVNNVPVRQIAKKYGFSATAVQHHKKPKDGGPSHIKKSIQAAKDAGVIQEGKNLQERIDEIYNTAFGLVKLAVSQGDPRSAGYNLSQAIAITRLLYEKEDANKLQSEIDALKELMEKQ
ncbi:MAG: hypothetical protein PHD64_10475 [Mesotoga sp.]|nr:hypothetical protein [Mesotoga sp.]